MKFPSTVCKLDRHRANRRLEVATPPNGMNELPKISIVTPSYNQGAYLGETLQSLVDQNYPNLEVIIQEGGSTDDSIEIAQGFADNYPGLFHVHVENDSGQADALNRGFRKATGEILGFLNSDDRLRAGCLRRVAQEIAPNRDRHIVFGRSRFFGNDPSKEGKEHPCEYTSHFEQLAIWKRLYNQIPQPSTFWTRQAWEQCGEIAAKEAHALDYDLFCRFSQRYRFHKIPEIWSDYRLHDASKTVNKTHEALMADCDAISRRYWGSWLRPLRWRCEFSYSLHQRSRSPKAIRSIRQAEAALLAQRRLAAFALGAIAAWNAPLAIGPRLLLPIAASRGWWSLARFFNRRTEHQLCPNQWIGPFYEVELARTPESRSLQATIELPDRYQGQPTEVTLLIDDAVACSKSATQSERLVLNASLAQSKSDSISVGILCSRYFVPSLQDENEDERLLSARLINIEQL